MGRVNESFLAVSGSHGTCPYMVKPLENLLLWNHWTDFHETWYVAQNIDCGYLFCSGSSNKCMYPDYPQFMF